MVIQRESRLQLNKIIEFSTTDDQKISDLLSLDLLIQTMANLSDTSSTNSQFKDGLCTLLLLPLQIVAALH